MREREVQVGVLRGRRNEIAVQGDRPLVLSQSDRRDGLQAPVMMLVIGVLPQQPVSERAAR